jgi:hypothetical protein
VRDGRRSDSQREPPLGGIGLFAGTKAMGSPYHAKSSQECKDNSADKPHEAARHHASRMKDIIVLASFLHGATICRTFIPLFQLEDRNIVAPSLAWQRDNPMRRFKCEGS